MTDRRVGSDGLNVELNVLANRQVGSSGLQVDFMPPLVGERQADSLGLTVEYTYPQGVQYGGADLGVELVPVPTRRLGAIGLMFEYVVSAVGEVTWGTGVFQLGGAFPAVQWEATAFGFSGGQYVDWDETNHRFAPVG